jgi:hypothetical protein
MRPKWLYVLLVVSLAANVTELSVFGVQWYRRHRGMSGFFGWVQYSAVRWNMRPVEDSYWPAWDSLGRSYNAASDALDSIAEAVPGDSARIAAATDEVIRTDRQRYRMVFESAQALQRPENERLRKSMTRLWRDMMNVPADSGRGRAGAPEIQ